MSDNTRDLQGVSQVFKNYKAEWLASAVFDFFQEPIYQHELTSNQPCILYGGRGSGKTTALLGLTYEGLQKTLMNGAEESPKNLPYYGLFHRVNGINAAEFEGDELTHREWERLFAHYWNLTMIQSLVNFSQWFEEHEPKTLRFEPQEIELIALSLFSDTKTASNLDELHAAVRTELKELSHRISNIKDEGIGQVSSLGAPVDLFVELLRGNKHIKNKGIFYIVDEYESLLTYQQKMVNTLVKYSSPLYTFKIGVRKYGLRTYATLSPVDFLEHPADFVQLTIEEKFTKLEFKKFAKSVCQARLKSVRGFESTDLEELMEEVDLNHEALRLSASDGSVEKAYKEVIRCCDELGIELKIDELDAYVIVQYSKFKEIPLVELLPKVLKQWRRWRIHLDNYRYHSLFGIRKGKAGLKKLYAGIPIYAQLADNNIRAFMELVEQAIIHWANDGGGTDKITAELQTKAAIYVGERRLRILEGRTLVGNSICRFVISLGRLYGLMAAKTYGVAPETNQFDLSDNADERLIREGTEGPTIGGLLTDAVMNLALVERTSTKPRTPGDSKGREFQIHPIFSAYFAISHRRKRKMKLSPGDFVGLIESPSETISRLLKSNDSIHSENSEDIQLDLW